MENEREKTSFKYDQLPCTDTMNEILSIHWDTLLENKDIEEHMRINSKGYTILKVVMKDGKISKKKYIFI